MLLALNVAEPFGGGSERFDSADQVEKRWVRFFRQPNLWWDHRRKSTAKSGSGFKHVEMHEVLLLSSCPEHLRGKLQLLDFPPNDEPFRARYSSHSHNYIAAALIRMFSRCGDMLLAQERFDEVVDRNVWLWSSLIKGYVDNGENLKALDLFGNMEYCEPNSSTYLAVLIACRNLAIDYPKEKQQWLEKGIAIHKQVKDAESEADTSLQNCLVELYGKCDRVDLAKEVFDNMAWKNESSWYNIITIHVERGENLAALDLYAAMGGEPGPLICIAALKACGGYAKQVPEATLGEWTDEMGHKRMVVQKGIAIHEKILAAGFDSNVGVACALVDMYNKCGRHQVAEQEFLRLARHGVTIWNAWMKAHMDEGYYGTVFTIWEVMDGMQDITTLVIALKAFSRMGSMKEGQRIHAALCRLGMDQQPDIRNDLIYLYGKGNQINKAMVLLDAIQSPDRMAYAALGDSVLDLTEIYRYERKDEDYGLENYSLLVAEQNIAAMMRVY